MVCHAMLVACKLLDWISCTDGPVLTSFGLIRFSERESKTTYTAVVGMLWVAALPICFVKIVVSFLSILGYVLAPLTFRHVILGSKKRNWSCKDSKDNRLDR